MGAVGREMLAVFCWARRHLTVAEGNTNIVVAENVHYEVANQFSINSDLAHQLIGEHLGTLRRYRNQADYEEDVVNLPGKVRAALAIADWVMDNLDALPDSP
jgi:hypothetical protein